MGESLRELLKSDLGPEQRRSLLEALGTTPAEHHDAPPAQQALAAAAPTPTEHEEQQALIEWADGVGAAEWPEVGLLYANANGQYRPGQRPEPGLRAGVPDLFLPVPRGNHPGLYIELKRADRSNGPSRAQMDWIKHLRRMGYRAVVCYGAGEAIEAIRRYMMEEGPA